VTEVLLYGVNLKKIIPCQQHKEARVFSSKLLLLSVPGRGSDAGQQRLEGAKTRATTRLVAWPLPCPAVKSSALAWRGARAHRRAASAFSAPNH
jgi:hypothetical protein